MKLTIAGGFYLESCIDPPWNELFGPGGRAAAALSRRGVEIDLHTYGDSTRLPQLKFQAGNFGFSLHAKDSPQTIGFHYLHFLSAPVIVPNPGLIISQKAIEITGDAILRYGFLEGDARVSGGKVVFDPQDAFKPCSFRENGSTAEHLVIVANTTEARLLTGSNNPEAMATALLEKEKAEAVVIKMGGEGALVRTRDKIERIDAIPTRTVRKIGSGDVFSAEFTWGWAIKGLDPIAAAKRATLQTAYYCEYQTLPIKAEVTLADLPALQRPIIKKREEAQYDVYLAGPFFSLSQRWLIEEARALMTSMDLRVFSPIHDVGEGPSSAVATADLEGLRNSRFVFACLDGCDPGTVFEIGYAHSEKIPILIYSKTINEFDKVMFEGSGCQLISDFVSAIYRAAFWNKF